MTKLAYLISKMEGFGIPGAIPTVRNNPGDLEHAPGETHPPDAPDSVGSFATPEEGWERLEEQLQEDAARGWTLEQFVYTYAPPGENDSEQYLNFLCAGGGWTPDTPVATALQEQA
jgi:hypothetical protein